MALSENLQYLRARQGLTQEQLAEQLDVSRQSVSKWESAASYPEMDTLLKLCDIFHTDLDTLLRGSAAQALAQDTAGYDSFMNRFALKIAGAVAAIIAGTALAALLNAWDSSGMASGAALLLAAAIATVVLVASGMQHSNFTERYPVIQDFYTQAEKDAFNQKFVWYVAGPVGAILFGVALLLVGAGALPEREPYESYLGAAFLLIVAVSVFFLVYGGIMKGKYNIAEYNSENRPSPQAKLRSAVCGAIMLAALIVFLALVFGKGVSERVCWVVFPIGGILCGIVSSIMKVLQEREGGD